MGQTAKSNQLSPTVDVASLHGNSAFNPVIWARIIAAIENGMTLRAVCRENGFPARSTVNLWISTSQELSDQYARACRNRTHVWADEIAHRAASLQPTGLPGDQSVNHARLEIDTMKWIMARTHPAIWGDKMTVENTAPKTVSADPIEAEAWEAKYGAPAIEGETVK